jgi:DNA-binding transcriptional MerR regulator
MPGRNLMTSSELADALGLTARTIQRYRKRGDLVPAEVSLGGHARWDLDDVREQIKKLREKE